MPPVVLLTGAGASGDMASGTTEAAYAASGCTCLCGCGCELVLYCLLDLLRNFVHDSGECIDLD